MSYSYKVVPFLGRSRGGLSSSDVAQQLESTINQHVLDGWEFIQLADVNIEVQPGCLAGLFGSKTEYVRFDQLIFRSQMPNSSINTPAREIAAPNEDSGGPAGATLAQQTDDVAARSKPYQPERLYGGKVACWKCGAANDRRQIRCSQCENELYTRP